MINKFKKIFTVFVLVMVLSACGKKEYSLNDDIKADGWVMKFNDIELVERKNGESVIKVYAHMKNISGENDYQPMIRTYGPDGTEVENYCICDEFYDSDECFVHNMVRNETEVDTYVMLEYKGLGDYYIQFIDNDNELHIIVNE